MNQQRHALNFVMVLLILSLIGFQKIESFGQTRKLRKIQKIIDKATGENLVGVVVYIKFPQHKEWIGVSGFQDLENSKALETENVFATGSIGKMYNAVAAFKLVEDGKLQLDDKVSGYLPAEIVQTLPNGNLITIRHLLSNQSGLFNYENDSTLNELYLSGNLRLDTLSHQNVLKRYVTHHTPKVLPGTAYDYSSTNFMLLAMIMDQITPRGHTYYLRKEILLNYGYHKTYYRETPPQGLVNHYGDIKMDGKVENLTRETIETTNWFIGDDGIYAPIREAAHFLQALMGRKILKDETVAQMTTWNDFKKPDYGLGLMADKGFPYKFLIGHSGRGIGTTTDLFYFPHQNMTVGIFCNTGIRQSSPVIKKEYLEMRNKIVRKLFLF